MTSTSESIPLDPAIDTESMPDASQTPRAPYGQPGREAVESLIFAVVLAFLFRTFIAEMFVIPTGSMAATLRGRHVDVVCDQCGFAYQVNASSESQDFDTDGNGELDFFEQQSQQNSLVTRVGCPNCGAPRQLDPDNVPEEKSRNGDRIIVSKFAYDLHAPRRFDVIVFKFPGVAKQNFIKRLVGLPNEMLKIWRGNVYTTPLLFTMDESLTTTLDEGIVSDTLKQAFAEHGLAIGEDAAIPFGSDISHSTVEEHNGWTKRLYSGEDAYIIALHEGKLHVYRDAFRILRKPPRKLLAMLQVVNDGNFVSSALHQAGYPLHWSGSNWKAQDNLRVFELPKSDRSSWLRYRNWPQPTPEQWEYVQDQVPIPKDTLPTIGSLIMDGYAYNYGEEGPHHWVGDLALEASVEVRESDQGAITMELVRSGVRYRCRFDLATGKAQLSIDGEGEFVDAEGAPSPAPSADTTVKGQGEFHLRMTNVDDELRVWVNNKLVRFDGPSSYLPAAADAPFYQAAGGGQSEDPGDTAPAAIGAVNAAVTVRDLRVLRDIYYGAKDHRGLHEQDFERSNLLPDDTPSHWLNPTLFANRRQIFFVLGENQFFPLGDNSPYSLDARRWDPPPRFDDPEVSRAYHYVHRDLLIGEALLIYWRRLKLVH